MSVPDPPGFVPPPYPQDRLGVLRDTAGALPGGAVDLSAGIPCDPPPAVAAAALADVDAARPYPASIGTPRLLEAACGWMRRRLGVDVSPEHVAACVGTKELVAGLPHWLRLRQPHRDTVLYPAASYPTYEMGAVLAGCRAVPVPLDARWRLDLDAIDPRDAERALCLWVNTPGNPTGGLDDLDAVAAWGRHHEVLVLSDECYTEFTWEGPPRTILTAGRQGVLAVHSVSKRSNLAGLRVGFYAGDPELVGYLGELRKHAGLMAPGPAQAAAAAALDDDLHVDEQRDRYRRRLDMMAAALGAVGSDTALPAGAFYLWAPVPDRFDGDEWSFATFLAEVSAAVVAPGEIYTGGRSTGRVRLTTTQPDDVLERVADRLHSVT
ncbi:MAG TPA: pyridoxal phosphate-dependent aminotransferase [Acidimicrobiales bacterium]